MSKYSFEFKVKLIQEYLEGKGGYLYISKIHGINDSKQLRTWINNYKEFGEEGLYRRRKNKKYSVHFKLNAVELYQTSEMSYREVANAIGINNPPLVTNWVRKFRDNGVEGLSNPKGRPSNMDKNKENAKKETTKLTTDETKRIKELEKQVRSLQIENAFLKELRKLRKQEAQQRLKNQSHVSSTASEDHSN